MINFMSRMCWCISWSDTCFTHSVKQCMYICVYIYTHILRNMYIQSKKFLWFYWEVLSCRWRNIFVWSVNM